MSNDSKLEDSDPSDETNEPAFLSGWPSGNAPPFHHEKSSNNRTGLSFPCVEVRTLGSLPNAPRAESAYISTLVSFPAYHFRSVIATGFSDQQKARERFPQTRRDRGRCDKHRRVKEVEMNVGTHSARLQKAAPEEKSYAWLHTESRSLNLGRNPSNNEGKSALSPPESRSKKRAEQTELALTEEPKMCINCGIREVYNLGRNMDVCEPCLYELSQRE